MSVYRPVPTHDAVPPAPKSPPAEPLSIIAQMNRELLTALSLSLAFGVALLIACAWVQHARVEAVERGEVTR